MGLCHVTQQLRTEVFGRNLYCTKVEQDRNREGEKVIFTLYTLHTDSTNHSYIHSLPTMSECMLMNSGSEALTNSNARIHVLNGGVEETNDQGQRDVLVSPSGAGVRSQSRYRPHSGPDVSDTE